MCGTSWNKGIPTPQKTRDKISRKLKGRKKSKEHIMKLTKYPERRVAETARSKIPKEIRELLYKLVIKMGVILFWHRLILPLTTHPPQPRLSKRGICPRLTKRLSLVYSKYSSSLGYYKLFQITSDYLSIG